MAVKSKKDKTPETEDIYSDEQREEQLEEDEISDKEAGFMEGYENPEDTKREIEQNLRKKKKKPQ